MIKYESQTTLFAEKQIQYVIYKKELTINSRFVSKTHDELTI
ncbi:hypothetical protein DSM02_3397 [Leeuwenhoekiella polynyae]|uniref:Uncharacterized protein n=1 Tax=Leeuwenhoekiella polynyae TaxID=1550906 RepID=A0A4V1KPC4_9FLAO|nr:hypothetical protein DSM02_3397 [Leeuwenhoekiella polynyae]